MIAPVKLASVMLLFYKYVLVKFVYNRVAPDRVTWANCVLVRFAKFSVVPLKFLYFSFVLDRFA